MQYKRNEHVHTAQKDTSAVAVQRCTGCGLAMGFGTARGERNGHRGPPPAPSLVVDGVDGYDGPLTAAGAQDVDHLDHPLGDLLVRPAGRYDKRDLAPSAAKREGHHRPRLRLRVHLRVARERAQAQEHGTLRRRRRRTPRAQERIYCDTRSSRRRRGRQRRWHRGRHRLQRKAPSNRATISCRASTSSTSYSSSYIMPAAPLT